MRLQTPDGRRYYETPIGVFPSVTTVLEATRDKKSVQTLQNWRDRIGHAEAAKITKAAGIRGTTIHSDVENLLLHGIEPTRVCPFWRSLRPFLPRVTKIYFLERFVYHPLGFAGTADLGAEIDNVPILTTGDWKTAEKRWEGFKKPDHRCQIAAYSAATYYVERLLPQRGIVVTAYGDGGPYKTVEIGQNNLVAWWRVFKHRLSIYQSMYPTVTDLVEEAA